MSETERAVLQLAAICKSPNEFIDWLEKRYGQIPEKGRFFFETGCILFNHSYFALALTSFNHALNYCTRDGEPLGVEAACYANLGATYHGLGEFKKSLEWAEKALQLVKRNGDRPGESKCYVNLGLAHHSLGEFGKAIECFEKSLSIAKAIEDRSGESKCYTNLGNAYDSLGEFGKATENYEKALKIARELGELDLERTLNFGLALHYNESDPQLAYDYCRRSIELSDIISGKLVEEPQKIGFYAQGSNAYQAIVPLSLKLRKEREAFEYTERSKSRAFLNLLAATEIKPTIQLTNKFKTLLADEEKYLVDLQEIQTRHLKQTKVPVEPGEAERILEKLNLIYNEMNEFDPEYVFARRAKPLSLNKIHDMLFSAKKDTALIEYFLTNEQVFIFVVSSKDKELHVKTVPLSLNKLHRHLGNYQREVIKHPEFNDIGDTWLGLSGRLIAPISEFVAKHELIYFVPHGVLHYLPLHALELNGEPLVKNHPVAYSPSASLLKLCIHKGSGELRSCASFGVAFEDEAENVARLFNTKADNGHLATKDRVREKCDKDVIHFSCHGDFNTADPLSSGVLLYDGVLTAREIFDLRLNTELVTLSACQTGVNERSRGDELIGLTRAFLYAGAPSVVVSLWSVDASSTHELMLEFYKLLKNGKDKATALQEAQKRIMKKQEYSHPYYWAPFILVGDWK